MPKGQARNKTVPSYLGWRVHQAPCAHCPCVHCISHAAHQFPVQKDLEGVSEQGRGRTERVIHMHFRRSSGEKKRHKPNNQMLPTTWAPFSTRRMLSMLNCGSVLWNRAETSWYSSVPFGISKSCFADSAKTSKSDEEGWNSKNQNIEVDGFKQSN